DDPDFEIGKSLTPFTQYADERFIGESDCEAVSSSDVPAWPLRNERSVVGHDTGELAQADMSHARSVESVFDTFAHLFKGGQVAVSQGLLEKAARDRQPVKLEMNGLAVEPLDDLFVVNETPAQRAHFFEKMLAVGFFDGFEERV